MSVSIDDVRHIAALAHLGLSPERAQTLTVELNGILAHMEVLARVDTVALGDQVAALVTSLPLRPDEGPPSPLAQPPSVFAPELRDGFFLVPRLSTHEESEAT